MTSRLDAELVSRGLARSRTRASALILQGHVRVDGRLAKKPAARVDEHTRIEVSGGERYVSRAAHKLIAGLDAFRIDPAGHTALDMGASTGGFTQVLRERGAAPVIAVDVGHEQLDPVIRADSGVIAVEGFNVRQMTPETLAAAAGTAAAPTLVTGDLSFISLRQVLPAVAATAPTAETIVLIKPQFEVGRAAIGSGVVTDPVLWRRSIWGVLDAAWAVGLATAGLIASPMAGSTGNREFLVHLSADRGRNPTEWTGTVDDVTETR